MSNNTVKQQSNIVVFNSAISLSGLISGIMCIFMITSIFYLGLHKKRNTRFILYLSICDLLICVVWMIRFVDFNSYSTKSKSCQVNAFLLIVCNNLVAFWNLVTALFIALTVWRPNNYKPDYKFEIACHIIVWPAGFFMGIIGLAIAPFEVWYGLSSSGICYISDEFKKIRVYFAIFEIGITLLVLIFLYTGVALYTWFFTREAKVNETEKSRKRKQYFRILFYPVIYFFFWFPYVVVRIQQAAGQTVPFATELFVLGLLPWTGFVDGIWYGYSRRIFKKLKKEFFNDKDTKQPSE